MNSEGRFMRRVEPYTMDLFLVALAPKQRVRKGEVVLGVLNERARLRWMAAVRAQHGATGRTEGSAAALKFFAYLTNVYPELGRYKNVAIRRGWKVVGIGKQPRTTDKPRHRARHKKRSR